MGLGPRDDRAMAMTRAESGATKPRGGSIPEAKRAGPLEQPWVVSEQSSPGSRAKICDTAAGLPMEGFNQGHASGWRTLLSNCSVTCSTIH